MNLTWKKMGVFCPTYLLKNGEQALFRLETTGRYFSSNPSWIMFNDSFALELESDFSREPRQIIDARSKEPIAEISCGLQGLMALRKDRHGSLGKVVTRGGDDFQMELVARSQEGVKITAQSGSKSLRVELHGKVVTLTTDIDLSDRYAAAVCLAVSSWFLCSGGAIRQFTK